MQMSLDVFKIFFIFLPVFIFSDFYISFAKYSDLLSLTARTLGLTLFAMFLTKCICLSLAVAAALLITTVLIFYSLALFGMLVVLNIPLEEMTLVIVIIVSLISQMVMMNRSH